jgi:hypothetical protein
MVCAGLDAVPQCSLYRDAVHCSEWILFSHQLDLLAKVPLALFLVTVQVAIAVWDYNGLCWVRHHPPVLIVSWSGPSIEWILISHQLGPLARVSLATFFVAVPVGVAVWDYYRLCWVRHRPPVFTVSWWGPLQWVNPLQPSIRSAGQFL